MSQQYDSDGNKSPERWKLKKEISLIDIISFITAALSVVYAYTTLDKRLTIVEVAGVANNVANIRQDEDTIRAQARIDAQLDKINIKIDRLLERR